LVGIAFHARLRLSEYFRVRWDSGAHPKWVSSAGGDAGPSCGGGCAPAAKETCLCDIESIDTKAVFTDPTRVPTVAELEARLFVGAAPPASLNYRYSHSSAGQPNETRLHEVYRLCTSSVCSGSKNKDGVEVYLRQLPPPTPLSPSSSASEAAGAGAGAGSGSAATITAIGGDGNGGSPSADIAIDGNMATHYKSGWNRKDPFVQVFGTRVRCSGARLHTNIGVFFLSKKEEEQKKIFLFAVKYILSATKTSC
jgi:hypothetical protein